MSIDEKETTHESFGLVSLTRWTSNHKQPFFGSTLKHDRGITMCLQSARQVRRLNGDWHYPERTLFQVEMTEAQFAELITTMNIGSGVPVTITHAHTEGFKVMERCPFVHKGEQALDEVKADAKRSTATLRAAIARLDNLVNSGGNVSKTMLRDILGELRSGASATDDHLPFIVSQFAEVVEKMVVEASATINAKGQAMAQRLEATTSEPPVSLPSAINHEGE